MRYFFLISLLLVCSTARAREVSFYELSVAIYEEKCAEQARPGESEVCYMRYNGSIRECYCEKVKK